jgi:hypothetical protein
LASRAEWEGAKDFDVPNPHCALRVPCSNHADSAVFSQSSGGNETMIEFRDEPGPAMVRRNRARASKGPRACHGDGEIIRGKV